jgi:hypothetical protein
LNPSLPADVDMVFRRSLARLPTDRYPTCTDFVWALEEASKAAVVPEPVIKAPVPDPVPAPAPAVIKVSKPRTSNSTGYLLVGVVLLAVIAGILLYKVWPHGGHAPASGDIQGKTEVAPVTAVTPAAQAAPVVTQFVADPPSIESGSAAVLRWNVTGATEVALDPGIGKVPVADKLEVRPRQATTYVLTATGPGGKVTEPVSVNVTPPAAGKPDKPNREQMYADALALLKTNQIAKAMELFRKAAALGEPRAMMELGEIQMEDNPSEAAKWFRKAADAGDSAGMLNLGAMYYLGNVENRAGVSSEDYAIAAYWYGKAAAAGNVDAMYNLGRMNENGQGMPKNLAKAKDLYEKAAGLGNAEAKAGLARLNGNRK